MRLNTATLTVILPHYDCADYLGLAVESVLRQDFRDLVLVVVDDCSPDDAWTRTLRPFADDTRLVALRTSRNVGHLRIKNAVLERVRGPYVGFQDADDISLPGRFTHQVRMLASGRADLVGCGYEYIDDAGRVTGHRRMPRHGNLWMRLGRTTVAHHPATVIRRDMMDRLRGFDGTVRLGADTDFHLRAARLYRLRNTRRLLYQYRIWPKSLTQAPDTGFGSEARRAYTEAMTAQEHARRQARSREELLPLLAAPPNDIEFELRPVRIG
ncbi:glycosyltransferase family 2 protein [Streptomyces sp. NPDC006923]|uniref:glycosyltransferase family 2 protein n=1 Tax=Streptomyces sp. NPDC006923 TaxID=3155355 RepID=UPI0033CA85C7